MVMPIFEQCITNMAQFGKLKQLLLCGMGEPLINKELSDMVCFAKKKGIAVKIVVITNGSLLTPELSDSLIDAGVDELRVSLQGVNALQYYANSGVKIEFDKFVSGLRYFYEHRKQCRVYMKAMDVMLKTPADVEKFYEIFQPLADELAIESLVPVSDIVNDVTKSGATMHGGRTYETKSCPLPFYAVMLTENGDLHSCGSAYTKGWQDVNLGSLLHNDFGSIWNKGIHKQLCIDLLSGKRDFMPGCKGCTNYKYYGSPKDFLDGHEEEILTRFNEEIYSNG
jgi:MoaA/NifB/PqqE/SkfB family radical SAM enzyme